MGKRIEKIEEHRGRGRPAIYTGRLALAIVALIGLHGLTGAQAKLASDGVQVVPGKPRQKLKVSLPTLGKLAKENGIKLSRGRRKVA